jgi:hypothetical protein
MASPDKKGQAVSKSPPSTSGMGAMIADQKRSIDEISSKVTTTYQVDVADGKLKSDAVSALAETLYRVPKEIRDSAIDKQRNSTPERLYLWAISNATIVFPYLTLESAVKNMKNSLYAPRSWGMIGDKFRLPKSESTADSPAWQLLREMFLAKLGPENVSIDADVNESVPDLSADICAKEPSIETIIIRLMELVRNPLSATIRKSELDKSENLVKNAVDFVLLEHIYQREQSYKNLTLSGPAVASGRRARRVESTGAGNKVTYTTVYVGYKLADLLCKYLPKVNAKSPESEPFVQIILGFIRKLIPEDLKDFKLPKSLFETPSNQLRALIREGPKIKTKKGDRHNLYVPLSFVKSSECNSYPEVARKQLTDIGSRVLNTLDNVNKLPIDRANSVIPILKDYLSFSYAISDKCRKEWRSNLRVPRPEQLDSLLVSGFPDFSITDGEDSYSPEELEDDLKEKKSRGDRLSFSCPFTGEEEIARIKSEISSLVDKKRANRQKR